MTAPAAEALKLQRRGRTAHRGRGTGGERRRTHTRCVIVYRSDSTDRGSARAMRCSSEMTSARC
jgi:hypothetical protein